MRFAGILLALLAPALALTACGDASDEQSAQPEGALYLAATRVWTDAQTTSYFHVVSSLEEGTSIDPSQAIEVPGSAKLYSAYGLGWFAIGSGEEPTITRYTLDSEGRLEEGLSISLQPYGVQDLWNTIYFVSPTKAYYPDRANSQLVVWNPTEMTVTGSVPLPETAREGYLSLYNYDSVRRGEKLLFSVGWFDWENDRVLPETGLVVLDTTSDELVRFDEDPRCGGVTQSVTLKSGDAYFVSSALAGAAHLLGRLDSEPCALRVRDGADSFDADYALSLGELTGGALAGEPVPAGQNSLFLRVFDEDAATLTAEDQSWSLTGQTVWSWWRWDLESGEAAPIDSLEPSTADVLWFEVDGHVYGTETTEDYAETTLIDLTAEGGPVHGLTAPGFLHAAARIR